MLGLFLKQIMCRLKKLATIGGKYDWVKNYLKVGIVRIAGMIGTNNLVVNLKSIYFLFGTC